MPLQSRLACLWVVLIGLSLTWTLAGCAWITGWEPDPTPTRAVATPPTVLPDSDIANALATIEAGLVRTVNGYTIEKYADLREADLSGAVMVGTLFAYADLTVPFA